MRWEDERYVRLYTRDTADWLAWSWDAQALFCQLLRKVDRAGLLPLGKHGKRSVAIVIGQASLWNERIAPALEELLADGCVAIRGNVLVIRNFVGAQEAKASDKARQQKARELARDLASAETAESVTPRDAAVTPRDEMSRESETCHAPSHAVTPSLAVPCRAEPYQEDPPPPPQRAREILPEEPSPAAEFYAFADQTNPNLWQRPPERSGFVRWYGGALAELSKRGLGDRDLRAAYERFCADEWAQRLSPPCPWNAWQKRWREYLAPAAEAHEAEPEVQQPDTPAGRAWADALGRVRDRGATYSAGWLEKLEPVGLADQVLELRAADAVAADWYREQYGGLLVEVLADEGLTLNLTAPVVAQAAGGMS